MATPKPDRSLFKRLKSPYLFPGLALIMAVSMAGTAFYITDWWQQELEQEYRAKKRLLDQSKRRHDTAIEQVEIADSYLNRYNRYRTHRMIGGLDRLRWSDGMEQISTTLGLKNMRISFSGLQPLDQDIRTQLKVRESIYKSYDLELSFVAQHEGDLFSFFSQVDNLISPMYLVRNCELTQNKLDDGRPAYSDRGNVEVRCKLLLLLSEPRERD